MTDDQLISFAERFVVSCEKIALALEGLHETYRRQYDQTYPASRPVRDAVVTRVPSEEDRIKESHGGEGNLEIGDWLSDIEEEEESNEFIGVREREWLDAQKREGAEQRAEKPVG